MNCQSAYAQAGVDFRKEHDVVDVFKALFEKTKPFTADLSEIGITPPKEIGYFSDGVTMNREKFPYKGLVMAMGTDGPGTKPLVHQLYEGDNELARACVGIDTVAMVANDLICSGARPAFLQDYIAWEKPDLEIAQDLAHGMFIGAEKSMATITGGENASLGEMIKGAVTGRGYDCCVFGVGISANSRNTEKDLTGKRLEDGDAVLGLRSSGLHCNGISLARKTLIKYPELGLEGVARPDEVIPELGKTPLEEILTPTEIYVKPVLSLLQELDVRGIVNITGEGVKNLHRLLEDTQYSAEISLADEPKPHPVFTLIQQQGGISTMEMYEVFNMGWGMYVVVPQKQGDRAIGLLNKRGVSAEKIGRIVKDDRNLIYLVTPKGEELFYEIT